MMVTQELCIQSYAFLLVVDPADDRVVGHSNNLPQILGADAGAKPLALASQLFSRHTLDLARRAASQPYAAPIQLNGREPVDWGPRQLLSHLVAGCLLLEIEPRARVAAGAVNATLQGSLLQLGDDLEAATDLSGALNATCDRIATTLGFDRVGIYRLEYEGGPGHISEESNNATLPSMLSLHFRGDDLPAAAFDKYRNNPVISFARPVGTLPRMMGSWEKLASFITNDLACRNADPTANRFLEENDLASQLSIAIRVNSRTWGLLVCHSRASRYLDQQHRHYARLVGSRIEREISDYDPRSTRRSTPPTVDSMRARVRQQISQAVDLQEGLTALQPSLVDYLTDCEGAAVLVDGRLSLIGMTPAEDKVTNLLAWATGEGNGGTLFHTDHLRDSFAPAGTFDDTAAGVLIAPLNKRRSEWIAWFRPEREEQVTYGTRTGFSLPWTEEQVTAARELQSFIGEAVTERYGRLRQVNEQLKIAYEEMEAFSYTVSHDLRAPLRGIDGFAEILLEDYGEEMQAEAIDLVRNIQHNAARMNQFISDILELSRVGRSTLVVNDCDVSRLVSEAEAALQNQLSGKVGVMINTPLPTIRGDYGQLRVVFHHLLSNAIKYSAREVVQHIEVGYREDGPEGGEFYVSDNGIGIASQHYRRIFGMFNRLVTEQDFEGNGVGLAIVRRILQRHNGDIRVESETGRGTTFYFYSNPSPTGESRT